MDAIDGFLKSNEAFAERFDDRSAPAQPRKRVAVVACMDARLDPQRALGLSAGDAHVIRNAGGLVSDDVIRSLAISQHLLGTEEVMLVHHTGCGMLGGSDEDFEARLEAESGERPRWRAGFFAELEASVRESIRRVRESPFLPRTGSVRGFIYEVETGRLREVAEPLAG